MFEKNSLPVGILASLLLAAASFGIMYSSYTLLESQGLVSTVGFRPMFRMRTCAIFSIALCAFLLNYYQKRKLYNAVRGVVIVIIILVASWLLVFGKYVF